MKKNEQILALSAGIAVVLLLSACVARPPQVENYDATWPEEVPLAEHANGAIYQSGRDVALFENAVARRVGDTVTINLMESTAAQKSSSTQTNKSSSIDLPGPTLFGSSVSGLETSIANNRKFDGSGGSKLSNQLEGFITVTVAQRLSNGNLLVRGQKWMGINQGREFVRIQGVIRPIDILPDNSIPSYKVADANIAYGAQGALADANRPGLLSRFFNSIWNPL